MGTAVESDIEPVNDPVLVVGSGLWVARYRAIGQDRTASTVYKSGKLTTEN